MTERLQPQGEQPVDMVEFGRDLSYEIADTQQKLAALTAQYNQLPQDVLETLAWRAVANIYSSAGVLTAHNYGVNSPEYQRLVAIKDQRLNALPDEESRKRAWKQATDWLNENFAE